MTEDEDMASGGQGDCAMRVFLDQDTDGHCRRWTRAERDGVAAGSGMSECFARLGQAVEKAQRRPKMTL
jgi:hypothetical protein